MENERKWSETEVKASAESMNEVVGRFYGVLLKNCMCEWKKQNKYNIYLK